MMRVVEAAEKALSRVPKSSDKWVDLSNDISEVYKTLRASQ